MHFEMIAWAFSSSLLWAEWKWDHRVGRPHLLLCSWGAGKGESALGWEGLEGAAGAQRYRGLPPCQVPHPPQSAAEIYAL